MFEPDLTRLSELPDVTAQYLDERAFSSLGQAPYGIRAAAAWTAALSAHDAEIQVVARVVPFFRYSAVGFLDASVDPTYEDLSGDFPPFGLILYADEPATPAVRELRLDLFTHQETQTRFPIVIRAGTYSDQGMGRPPGQVACWATTRMGKYAGWLTARHIAPALGTVLDAAPDCTDAALVATARGQPPGSNRVAASQNVTAGVSVDLRFHQATQSATVIDVSTDFNIFKNPKFPLRFSLDRAGVRGNSGALVVDASSGGPLGIYLGSFVPWTSPAGRAASGCALALYQLETMLDLEVYQ